MARGVRYLRSAEADLFASLAQSDPDPLTRDAALEALAASRAPDAGTKLLALYPSLQPPQRRSALNALSSSKAGAKTIAMNPMGRIGQMSELQNLATFLISGGCDWINGETIALDGAQALATGGSFYELRNWSDADWQKARDSIEAQNKKDRSQRA